MIDTADLRELLHAESIDSDDVSVRDCRIARKKLRDLSPQLARDNIRLRQIIADSAAALKCGAFISPDATVDFMALLPREIELRLAALKDTPDA